MAKKFDLVLVILCIIPFGFDKLYKGSILMFLIKFFLHFIGIGFVWWLFDVICALTGNYRVNPFK
ncbi:MAG TPA: hypothetical protein VIL26_01915 [Clostridia bacterium]